MSRKETIERKNLGAEYGETVEDFFDGPDLAQARTSSVMVERVLYALLKSEFTKLAAPANEANLARLFSHIFDPMAGNEERQDYVVNFQRRPPTVVLGYPRTTVELPIVSIVLGEESESETRSIGNYVGESLPGEKGPYAEYVGIHFQQTYNIFCYAEHPVVCAYLYHFIKLILIAAQDSMVKAGIVDPHLSGGDLAPDEGYVPENVFARVIRLSCQSLSSVPVLKLDPAGFRVSGVFMEDVVVDGVRGGVSPYNPSTEEDE